MDEQHTEEGRNPSGGLRPARLAKIALLVLAFAAAALVGVAVLNPEPETLRIDYGAFSD